MRTWEKKDNIKKANILCESIYLQNKLILEEPQQSQETNQIKNYADLKKIINVIRTKQKGQKIGAVALDVALGFIPGMDAVKNTLGFIKAAMAKPDTKKTNTWLDRLDIDDITSQLLDDTIENSFIEYIAKDIDSKPDTTPLDPNFNMNDLLINWLETNYKKRTISGIPKKIA